MEIEKKKAINGGGIALAYLKSVWWKRKQRKIYLKNLIIEIKIPTSRTNYKYILKHK